MVCFVCFDSWTHISVDANNNHYIQYVIWKLTRAALVYSFLLVSARHIICTDSRHIPLNQIYLSRQVSSTRYGFNVGPPYKTLVPYLSSFGSVPHVNCLLWNNNPTVTKPYPVWLGRLAHILREAQSHWPPFCSHSQLCKNDTRAAYQKTWMPRNWDECFKCLWKLGYFQEA